MQNLGDNGVSYEDNWKVYDGLLDNVQMRIGQLNQEIARRDGFAQELHASRGSADSARIKTLEHELFESEKRVEQRRAQLSGAYERLGAFELSVGPEHGARLAERRLETAEHRPGDRQRDAVDPERKHDIPPIQR